jgi:beta-N-acetylhexosaminidase
MGAVGKNYSSGEAAVASVKAGADILLFDHGEKQQKEAYNSLIHALKTGQLTMKRVDESVERILRMKRDLGLWKVKNLQK